MRHFDDVYRGTGGDRDGGEFKTNKAGADDHDLARLRQPIAQHIRIGQGAQRQYALKFSARHRQHPGSRTGCQHDLIAFKSTTGGEANTMSRPIDRRHRLAGNQLDLLFFVKRFGPQPQFVEPAFAGEIGF